jgi:hypothetical protein
LVPLNSTGPFKAYIKDSPSIGGITGTSGSSGSTGGSASFGKAFT